MLLEPFNARQNEQDKTSAMAVVTGAHCNQIAKDIYVREALTQHWHTSMPPDPYSGVCRVSHQPNRKVIVLQALTGLHAGVLALPHQGLHSLFRAKAGLSENRQGSACCGALENHGTGIALKPRFKIGQPVGFAEPTNSPAISSADLLAPTKIEDQIRITNGPD